MYYDGCVPTCEFPSGYEDCEDMDFVGFGCWCNYGYVFDDNGNCIALEDCEEIIYGCTDPNATNYNSAATVDDGSCEYDSDGDGVIDSEDSDPNNPYQCSDIDADT